MTTDLDFAALRSEFPRNGKPMPVRTARKLGARISSYKIGKHRFWPRQCVEAFKQERTVRP